MIKGDKVSAYGVTRDKDGREVIEEWRMCQHCQASWHYQPGSGHKVGLCSYCNGLLCTNCLKMDWYKTDDRCVPFSEGMDSISNDYIYNPNLNIFLRK